MAELSHKEIYSYEDLSSEIDFVRLKCELLVEGLRLEDSAREGIGVRYKEQVHFIYEWDFSYHRGIIYPQDFVLPTSPEGPPAFDASGIVKDGLVVMFRANEHSPFLIRRNGEQLILEKNGHYLCQVRFTPRPEYYGKKTSDGVPMNNIIVHGGVMGLLCTVSQYCHYFKDGDQCRFCALMPTKEIYGEKLLGIKRPKQVAEAVAAAWEDGICRGLTLTGGLLPERREIDRYVEIVEAIKKARQWADEGNLPICVVPAAPAPGDYGQLDQLRETGHAYLSINLEVGNPDWFKAICPGKARNGGFENWLKALEYGVEVFGQWKVRSNFVPGIEPRQDTLRAWEYLAERGIWTHFFIPWCPQPGSLLEGHRSPSGEWFFKLTDELSDIWEKLNAPIEELNKFPGANDSVAFDMWRAKRGLQVAELNALLKQEVT
jgi:hypothetical protein